MRYNFIVIIMSVLLWGCTDDTFDRTVAEEQDGPLAKAYLSLSVNDFNVISAETRTANPVQDEEQKEKATADENRIENIWVFQFGVDGNQLISPMYYEIAEQEQLENLDKIEVLLKEEVVSTIFVVANTNNNNWVKGDSFKTLEGLKKQAISNPEPILFSNFSPIPMEGSADNVTVTEGSVISIPVSRMFAKLKISFDDLPDGMTPKSIQISNIPKYCQVNTLGEGVEEENAANYEMCDQWITRSINTVSGDGAYSEGKEYVVYIPENLQGEKGNQDEEYKNDITTENESERVPDNALMLNLEMNYLDPNSGATKVFNYKVYPGSNIYNNFNIKRNCVYRVKIKINSASQANHTPSSNCFVVIPGQILSFEPYYRTERGGGYNIANYLTPNDESKTIKRVDIIWQTWNAIGDNSAGNLVQYKEDPEFPLHSEIIVKTQKEGNALIGAYNADGYIIWSWHIWITDNDPGNVGNAIVYTTYAWDSKGIKYNEDRVEGYAVMPCNLGALANSPEDVDYKYTPTVDLAPDDNDITNDIWYCTEKRTYGTIYQWGRKDPFPPLKRSTRAIAVYPYDNSSVIVYDNNNKKIIMTTDGFVSDKEELFRTVLTTDAVVGTTFESGINYSIKHPTIHIAGAEKLGDNRSQASKYINGGNWLPVNDQCLWGAKEIDPNNAEKYSPYTNRAIWRNYNDGPENKTIFDPCPTGWRVPPGDLWLGFTNNGLNTGYKNGDNILTFANIPEYCKTGYLKTNPGFWLCLDGWHTSDKNKHTFFPTQGSRMASGEPLHGNVCGNYHNATPDLADKTIQRVNILHLHSEVDGQTEVNTFENNIFYYNKSVAGPIRCVRDRK